VIVRWVRQAALALLAGVGFWAGIAAPARADDLLNVGPNPIVDVTMSTGTVTVQTWDRPQVSVVSDGGMNVQHLPPSMVDPKIPREIPSYAHTIQTPSGPVSLPAEPFALPALQGVQHDEVQARGFGNTTVMVPNGTALVMAHVERGRITLNNYRGAFYTQVHNGGVFLNRVTGSGYAESLRGRIIATDSTFDRIRVRSAMSNITFDRCTSHQIEASSTYGSIVYNNGSFQPGLARFESEHGNVALGVRGGAQIGAHSETGHVSSSFPNSTQVRGGNNTAEARVEGGGPVVTAASRDGSVYLYNGSIESHPQMQAEMRGQAATPRFGVPASAAAPRFGVPSAPTLFRPGGGVVPAVAPPPQQQQQQQQRQQPRPRDERPKRRPHEPPPN